MMRRRGPGHQLLKNSSFGYFNDLYVIDSDGTVVDVSEIATSDPAILTSLEQRVTNLENKVDNLVLPLIQLNVNAIAALALRMDSVEAGKQDTLTATYPLSVAGNDVHFDWTLGAAPEPPWDDRLDSHNSSISQLFVRVSSLESAA